MTADGDEMQMIRDCMDRESRLSDWERSFIDSVAMQFERIRSLSPRQFETLERIWDRATSKG